MRTSSRPSSSFMRRLFSTGSIHLNPDSREELLTESQESSHDPGDGGHYGPFSYVSPFGGAVGHAHSSGPGGFGYGFGQFGGIGPGFGPGAFGSPAGFGAPGDFGGGNLGGGPSGPGGF